MNIYSMKKLWIIGDSFSTNMSPKSWINHLPEEYVIVNLSMNGISQYRLYHIFLDVREDFQPGDTIIFCHTNPNRIYLPDRTPYPTRFKTSHSKCDLVLGDVSRHGMFWRFISYMFIKYFYDEEYYNTIYDLMIKDMNKVDNCKIINMSGFVGRGPIVSVKDIFDQYRGNINHLSLEGNRLVAERISKLL